MNIQKEVEKFEAKKSKLVNEFVHKVTMFVNKKYETVAQIDKTVEALDREKRLAEAQAEEAKEILRGVE